MFYSRQITPLNLMLLQITNILKASRVGVTKLEYLFLETSQLSKEYIHTVIYLCFKANFTSFYSYPIIYIGVVA